MFVSVSKIIEIKNLSLHTAEADLRAYFSKFGEISKCFLMRDRLTGQKNGTAYIKATSAAYKAVLDYKNHFLNGTKLNVSHQGTSPVDMKQATPSEETNFTDYIGDNSTSQLTSVRTNNRAILNLGMMSQSPSAQGTDSKGQVGT